MTAAVPPCFPALHQGWTAWAALTGGVRRRLLDFTGAIRSLDGELSKASSTFDVALHDACRALTGPSRLAGG